MNTDQRLLNWILVQMKEPEALSQLLNLESEQTSVRVVLNEDLWIHHFTLNQLFSLEVFKNLSWQWIIPNQCLGLKGQTIAYLYGPAHKMYAVMDILEFLCQRWMGQATRIKCFQTKISHTGSFLSVINLRETDFLSFDRLNYESMGIKTSQLWPQFLFLPRRTADFFGSIKESIIELRTKRRTPIVVECLSTLDIQTALEMSIEHFVFTQNSSRKILDLVGYAFSAGIHAESFFVKGEFDLELTQKLAEMGVENIALVNEADLSPKAQIEFKLDSTVRGLFKSTDLIP